MARLSLGDIDPKREDLARPNRSRRNRAKPEPLPSMAAAKPKLRAAAIKRPLIPGIVYEKQGGDIVGQSPHSDSDLWYLQLASAFATRSHAVVDTFVQQLEQLCSATFSQDVQGWKPNETEMNSILAIIAGFDPRSIAEAALAAQMVAVHLMTMKIAAQALNNGSMVMERDAAIAGKLARTFTMQLDSMQALKGKRRSTRQTITVRKELHQSVHYHDHRGERETGEQSHGPNQQRTPAVAASDSLPCADTSGRVVPMPRRARSE